MNDRPKEQGLAYPEAPAPLRIKDLPVRLQPREMLEEKGPSAAGDDVLLAVLLRTGMRRKNVLDLATEILARFPTLADLSRASLQELMSVKSVGRVKALTLIAAFELGRRARDVSLMDAPRVRAPADVAGILRPSAVASEVERFWILPLNKKNRLITKGPVEVTKGLLDSSPIHQREVFLHAIRANSASVVLAHNHPSGDPAPSADDLAITRQMVAAGRIVGIQVLDHVIVGREGFGSGGSGFFSIRESGMVDFGV